jgi:hypothetical protein
MEPADIETRYYDRDGGRVEYPAGLDEVEADRWLVEHHVRLTCTADGSTVLGSAAEQRCSAGRHRWVHIPGQYVDGRAWSAPGWRQVPR